jgi:hypothetical protein
MFSNFPGLWITMYIIKAILNYSNVNKLKSNCTGKKRIKVDYGDERHERRSIF